MNLIFKRTTGEKIQATLFLLIWVMVFLYFGIEGYSYFSHPYIWLILIAFGFIVSIRQWSETQISILLKENSFLWKSLGFSREILYEEVYKIENNADRNRIFFYLKDGKKYYIRLGDSDYKDFFSSFVQKNKFILENLEIPKRVYLSSKYLLSILVIFIIPLISISFYIYTERSIFSLLLGSLTLIVLIVFLFSSFKNLPLYYEFRESYVKGKFLLKKNLYIPYQDIDKIFIAVDKKGFWYCSFIERDSSVQEISESSMSLSLYVYFIFLREKIAFSKNA